MNRIYKIGRFNRILDDFFAIWQITYIENATFSFQTVYIFILRKGNPFENFREESRCETLFLRYFNHLEFPTNGQTLNNNYFEVIIS